MSRRMWANGLALTLLALVGCQRRLPTAPSELTAGIVIYEHADFLGASAHLTTDIRDLRDIKGPCLYIENGPYYSDKETWNDCISSVRVAPGWRAIVYRDDDFRDRSLAIDSDISNLELVEPGCDHHGMNDCITSIRVMQP